MEYILRSLSKPPIYKLNEYQDNIKNLYFINNKKIFEKRIFTMTISRGKKINDHLKRYNIIFYEFTISIFHSMRNDRNMKISRLT